MFVLKSLQRARLCLVSSCFLAVSLGAQVTATVSTPPLGRNAKGYVQGTVVDPLGAAAPRAEVTLLSGDAIVATGVADARGVYAVALPKSGDFRLRASAAGFESSVTSSRYFSVNAASALDLTLDTPTLTQEVTVTATGVPVPEAQTGADVTVLPQSSLRYQPDVQDPLRLVAGLQVNQTGQMGGTTGLRIRGASTDANKVLIDGVPANNIGGAVEFTNLQNVGLESVEILREPNSALYGSDALAGVVSLRTTRGTTPLPLFTYAGDAGNFHTYRNEVTAGTQYKRFDVYSAFARLQTANNIQGSEFHNATYAGNFGYAPNAANDLRFTVRHIAVSGGQPNAIAFYGIADAAQQKEQDTYYNGSWNNQTTAQWHNQIRYGGTRQSSQFNDFGATGIFDPVNYIYDGKVVTIKGANGYSVTGQAAFQYSNVASQYLSTTKRDFVYAQSDYAVTPHLLALGGFKYENESGSSVSVPSYGAPGTYRQRGNYSYTAQFSGDIRNRLFYNVGTGLENNGLFGFAATPRASLAYYLVRPSGNSFFSGTKLHGTFGKGIKEPSVYQQANSLYDVLSVNAPALIAQYHVAPLGAENSRTYDAGVDQQIAHGRGRVGLTYFHDEFTNGVEYVPQSGLKQLKLPTAVVNQFPYGDYVNSLAFRTQGLEVAAEYRLSSHVMARGGYTYTAAVVQHSYSSDNQPSTAGCPNGGTLNPYANFANVCIGQYSPLTGAQPFRVAPNSGYFGLSYTRSKFYGSLTGTLLGKRDDSTFLSDSNFDVSLLLPNHNLDGAYQRLDAGLGYNVTPRVNLYANLQNLLSEHYQESIGYPALPFTFRTGVKFSFGGESWKLK